MTKQISFNADDETVELIERLKKELHAPTTAAVFRRALAFTRIAAEEARESDGIVTIKGRGEPDEDGVNIAINA
ncbi:MAG: ribbon-helix-helix protein, CopG family [Pseudomonadota bacterium]